MNRYTLSFAASISHVPEHPERTASKPLEWDTTYQVWPSRHHWRACKVPAGEAAQ